MAIATFSQAQTCDQIVEYVENNSFGTMKIVPGSEAIHSYSFRQLTDSNYQRHYFFIVRFRIKNSYQPSKKYIYELPRDMSQEYLIKSINMYSYGKAFWALIEPYGEHLNCGI